MTPWEAVSSALDRVRENDPGARIGIAVSGGGDSVALMHLARDWAQATGAPILAATVDHRLRPEAAAEAARVAATCAGLGIAHEILTWTQAPGPGNLQAEARDARRRLLSDWADRQRLAVVCLGHTADDQAETFLMRLARGSGVDGLACMDEDRDPLFLRPLLEVRRAALRDWLTARGIGWIDDPTNEDDRFDRVKARRALEVLAPLGLTVERLTATAAHMNRARLSLWRRAADHAGAHVTAQAGDLLFDADALQLGATDEGARVLSAALMWIGGAAYRPRYETVVAVAEALLRGETRTLSGVLMRPEGGGARLMREAAACAGPLQVAAEATVARWDGRWQIRPPPRRHGLFSVREVPGRFGAGAMIRALGEDLAAVPGWRETGLPRQSLIATPAVIADGRLIAAPAAGLANGWDARPVPDFRIFLLSR